MLFYNFNSLNHFINDNLIVNLKIEKDNITQIIALYNKKKAELSLTATNIIEIVNSITARDKLEDFHERISLLRSSFEEIDYIETLALKLKEDLNLTISLYDKGLENNENEIKANLVEYNKRRDELFRKILEFENNNIIILNSAIELLLKTFNVKVKKANTTIKNILPESQIKVDIELEPYDHNILIISEKEQKAYLPFFYNDILNIYKNSNNKYKTMQDVIEDLYIVPLSNFKNSSISRFKEAFNLIRKKENGSITKALDLGLELMFKYNLNPIIISACRNIDELDIYLDCLEDNQLYDFTCFEIKFEVSPQLNKNRKKIPLI